MKIAVCDSGQYLDRTISSVNLNGLRVSILETAVSVGSSSFQKEETFLVDIIHELGSQNQLARYRIAYT